MKIGFLASHRGSNMQAVVEACRAGTLVAKPAVLICNNRAAEVVRRSEAQGIPTLVLNATTQPDPDELDRAMLLALRAHDCDLIVLAGFMKKIGPRVLESFSDRIINLHPSLLPKFGGKGMYGRAVHEAVLAAGEKETGVTIHLVNANYDQGRILAQCAVPVMPDDTSDTLGARVLEREHRFLIEIFHCHRGGKAPAGSRLMRGAGPHRACLGRAGSLMMRRAPNLCYPWFMRDGADFGFEVAGGGGGQTEFVRGMGLCREQPTNRSASGAEGFDRFGSAHARVGGGGAGLGAAADQ